MVNMMQRKGKGGIVPVPLAGDEGASPEDPRLVVRDNKVFLVAPSRKRRRRSQSKDRGAGSANKRAKIEESDTGAAAQGGEENAVKEETVPPTEIPVGLVILHTEPADVEAGHASMKMKQAVAEAKSRIDDYEESERKVTGRSKRSEKCVTGVAARVELEHVEKDGVSSCLQMEGETLVWTRTDGYGGKQRVKGPLAWDQEKNQLSGDELKVQLNEDAQKALHKKAVVVDRPVKAQNARVRAAELKTAVENANASSSSSQTQKALFRALRKDDKDGWERITNGKNGVPGLLEAYYAGGVKIANGPGFTPLEDKELCAHMDKLVRHYTGEEPILRTIPTEGFATDHNLIHSVFDNPLSQPNVVVKRVDGRGGDAVWVGKFLSREDFLAARPLVAAEPDAFIVQKYTPLSQVDKHLADLRGPALIFSTEEELSGGKGAAVSPVLWGRGVPLGGSGKVNISEAGFEFTIATSCNA